MYNRILSFRNALLLGAALALSLPLAAQTVITVDNADSTGVTITGSWTSGTNPGFWGANYIHDGNTAKGSKSVRFSPNVATTGFYQVLIWWTASTNRADNVPVDINYSGGTDYLVVNQKVDGAQWNAMGNYRFAAGTTGNVLMSNTGTNGYVFADAIRLISTAQSPFGISMSQNSKTAFMSWAPTLANIGVAWARGTQGVNAVTPELGQYSWTSQDALINNGASIGMKFLGFINYNADWINSNTQTFPTDNLPAWGNYVYELVNHCKDRVTDWEVGNEPPNFTSNGTPAQYALTMNTAYTRAKQADPNCRIGLAAKANHVDWLRDTIDAGAASSFDFITLHPYECMGAMQADGFEGQFMSIASTVRKMLAHRAPSKVNVPIYFTELGEPIGAQVGTYTVTADSQAGGLVKAYSMGIAQGISRIDWYEGKDGEPAQYGLISSSATGSQPRLSFTAMAQMIKYLGHNPVYKGWVLLNNKHYGFVFQGLNTSVMTAWTKRGTSETVNFGQSVKIVDPRTGTVTTASSYLLTENPIIVLNVPAALINKAQTNKNLPFSWGGDYTNAASVSFTAPATEAGLHRFKGAITATEVTAPYGAALYIPVNGNPQFFAVDPNFLSYTATPIEISVVCRRNQTDTSKSIRISYESPSSHLTNTVSQVIPANNGQWHTLKWTINDPQFVALYGVNFQISNVNTADFYVQSVSVRKLP